MPGALRELLIWFGADTSQVDGALQKVDKGVATLQGRVGSGLAKIGTAFAGLFAIHELESFVQGTLDAANQIHVLSARLGVGTTDLQQFQYAAKLVGVDAQGSALAIGFLNRTVGEALTGSKEAGQEFQKLGIHLKDSSGKTKSTNDVLLEVSDSLAKMPDQQTRAATAVKLFGRAGQQLLPVLQNGSKALKATYQDLSDLGGLMSEDFIASARAAEVQTTKLGVAWTGFRVRVVNALLPSLTSAIKAVTGWVQVAQKGAESMHAFQHAIEFVKIAALVAGVWGLISAVRALVVAETVADLASPFTLALIAIGLLYLAFDELKTFMEGGKSLIGDYLDPEQAIELRNALQGISDDWPSFKDAASDALEYVKNTLLAIYDTTRLLASAIGGVVRGAASTQSGAPPGFTEDMQKQIDDRQSANIQNASDNFADVGKYASKLGDIHRESSAIGNKNFGHAARGTSFGPDPSIPLAGPPQLEGGITSSLSGPGQAASGVSQTVQVGDLNVTVQAGPKDDPAAVGKAVGQGARTVLQKEMVNAYNAVKTK